MTLLVVKCQSHPHHAVQLPQYMVALLGINDLQELACRRVSRFPSWDSVKEGLTNLGRKGRCRPDPQAREALRSSDTALQ